MRYAAGDAGEWLESRMVLRIPGVLGPPGTEGPILPVDLTRDRVEDSPDIDADKPLLWQHPTKGLASTLTSGLAGGPLL